ncbi:alpha mannosidase-like protein [Steccherinum ochraceum]|uniref:alpha-1,2-Mannosidase n=1 Tax=Steccherinum ochraceum TaxID=92696 RepID=A0A4R0RWM8_9APHY|nr:alpha mannosidase-like protein [Steccherinum ochraceum]
MRWPAYWSFSFLALLLISLETQQWSRHRISVIVAGADSRWTIHRKLEFRERTRELFNHGYTSYMRFAFPLDELAPLSCTGRGPDWHNPANVATNDVAGNFSVTLIDTLDTLVIMNDTKSFETAVRNVINWVSFDVNTKPQVFETTIRVLGGLLSGHQFASQVGQPFYLPWYRDQLLKMAHDLGERLLPAFHTTTGLPIARINLRHGVPKGESTDTCAAGAGSLILEFGTLSRLTGDDRFEKAAYKAFFALWNRKSAIGLIGNPISTWSGSWLHPETNSIGAGVDSFYEYALKWYILSGDVEFLDVWQASYAAVMRYTRSPDGFWYRSVNIHTGDVAYLTVDSLSAFWPGLQVLAGDVENAVKSHMLYWNLWKAHSGLPEVYDMKFQQAVALQYPLRPEFVESTWYLYRATKDPFYLDVGERIFHDITARSRVECGLTGISDLSKNYRDDRMESFVLSETLKYLYLLFDEDNPLHSDDSNYVLTTEGHLLTMDRKHQKPLSAVRRKLRGVEHLQCPAYQSPFLANGSTEDEGGLYTSVDSRPDTDYVRYLVGTKSFQEDTSLWRPDGWCELPQVELYSYDFILSADGQNIPEDFHPSHEKVEAVADGYMLHDVAGIRAHIVSRLDGKGYDVTQLGPYAVRTGQLVYVDDPALVLAPLDGKGRVDEIIPPRRRAPQVTLRIHLPFLNPKMQVANERAGTNLEFTITAHTAMFGGDPAPSDPLIKPIRFGHGEGVNLVRVTENPLGCLPYTDTFDGDALVVRRGDCTFLEKLVNAKHAGASGVIVISEEDAPIHPSADDFELKELDGFLDDVAVVVVTKADGDVITRVLGVTEEHMTHRVVMNVAPKDQPTKQSLDKPRETQRDVEQDSKQKPADGNNKVLYLNGHPLVNTRLLV